MGAFLTRNWLEEWTSFGAERDYALAGVRGVPRSRRGTGRRRSGRGAGRHPAMRWHRMLAAALLVGSAVGCAPVARGQQKDVANRDETARMRATPARLAVWTDRPVYLRSRSWIRAYAAIDPMTDRQRYHLLLYLERLDSGQRYYLELRGDRSLLTDSIVDAGGRNPVGLEGQRLPRWPPAQVWSGSGLEPGRWQFVAELRSPDTTEIVKRAQAKFVVARWYSGVLGEDGSATVIAADTTWHSDRVWALRGPVFVQSGATLVIEPGTVVLGLGARAAIVVEQGGRIVAHGRPDAPVVMTCDAPAGQRFPGCWGGLAVLGNAPMSRGSGLAVGVAPQARAAYGGQDAGDASGVLEYVRVEFAGAAADDGAHPPGIGLYGVGSGTRIEHLQAHASAGDGILFSGGTANCAYCVSSGAEDDALAWELGWKGTAQHVFLQKGLAAGGCGINGANDALAFDGLPRSAPTVYNVTLSRDTARGRRAPSGGCGILLHSGSALTARNVIVEGYPSDAIILRDNAESLFLDGTSSFSNAILHGGAGRAGGALLEEGLAALVDYRAVDPLLVSAASRPNPDPRPRVGSPALEAAVAAVPPSEGLLDTSAQCIGAFCDSNWLEEWTLFGSEAGDAGN